MVERKFTRKTGGNNTAENIRVKSFFSSKIYDHNDHSKDFCKSFQSQYATSYYY